MAHHWLASFLLLGVTACGSTVPAGMRSTGPELGSGRAPGPVAQAAGGSSANPATGSPRTLSGRVAGDRSSESTRASSRAATGGLGEAGVGPAAPVEVGFEYATGVSEFASALGISADVGNGMHQANAIVAWVNARGGLAGHPIKPVFYALDLTRTDPYSQFMDEMCSRWTEDHRVVAAFAYANADFSPLAQCLTKHHAVFSSYASYTRDRDDFRQSRNWVETSTLSAERLAELQVQTFAEKAFFAGQSKVGLLAYDYKQARRLTDLLVAKLKQRGLSTVVYRIRYGSSTPELGATIGSIQNAVLRFRSEGIQRVMSAAYPGAMAFFMRYADSQRYNPRYGLSSYDALGSLPANAPASQLRGAVAAGWWPTADLRPADRPVLNASGRICRAAFSKAGIPSSQDTYSFGYCDAVLSLQAASRLIGRSPMTGDALRAALERLRSSYTSPSMLGTTLTSRQHDGVSRARPLAFDDSCTCWRPSGGIRSVP